MSDPKLFPSRGCLLAITALFALTTSICAGAQTLAILYNLSASSRDGCCTYSAMTFDSAGNLYGVRAYYGPSGGGTVFELLPKAGGGWSELLLHSFGNGTDGVYPYGHLVFDADGNLYGTTERGGLHGYGTVFELSPKSSGGWSEKVLRSFKNNGTDGYSPYAGVIFDAAGNLYGTTLGGGAYGDGTVFELTPSSNGWTERILRSFSSNDGASLFAGVVFDTSGNLYGAACYGGTHGNGTVFQLTPQGESQWGGKVLHNFGSSNDGQCPIATPVIAANGDIYGTTVSGGGSPDYGVVYSLSKAASNTWQETPVRNFSQDTSGASGITPWAGVVVDSGGNLYGTTDYGGNFISTCGAGSCGTLYELSNSGGTIIETILDSFSYTNGSNPVAALTVDASGNLYGTAADGGTNENGVVFEVEP